MHSLQQLVADWRSSRDRARWLNCSLGHQLVAGGHGARDRRIEHIAFHRGFPVSCLQLLPERMPGDLRAHSRPRRRSSTREFQRIGKAGAAIVSLGIAERRDREPVRAIVRMSVPYIAMKATAPTVEIANNAGVTADRTASHPNLPFPTPHRRGAPGSLRTRRRCASPMVRDAGVRFLSSGRMG